MNLIAQEVQAGTELFIRAAEAMFFAPLPAVPMKLYARGQAEPCNVCTRTTRLYLDGVPCCSICGHPEIQLKVGAAAARDVIAKAGLTLDR